MKPNHNQPPTVSPLQRGALLVAGTALCYAAISNYSLNIATNTVEPDQTGVDVDVVAVTPIDISCFAAAETNVAAAVRTKISVVGKKIGATGYKATMTGTAETSVCFDGSAISITVDETTGRQAVTVDRTGKKFITEWQSNKEVKTDVEGELAEAGDILAGFGDLIGIDRYKDAVTEEKAELASSLETAVTATVKTNCLTSLNSKVEELVKQGILLRARNQNIDPNSLNIVFTGEIPQPAEIGLGTNAGKIGFEVTDSQLENITCEVNDDAFSYVDERTKRPLTAEDKTRIAEAK